MIRLDEAAKSLKENGGIITTDIDDPKLTHVIMDDDDSGRYAELSRRTSKYVWSIAFACEIANQQP
jgi:DNA ligase-4